MHLINGGEAKMTPNEEEYYKQYEATPEEIAKAQGLNPDQKPEQIAEEIAQMKGQVGRERCVRCGAWSGEWITVWDEMKLGDKLLCPKCELGEKVDK